MAMGLSLGMARHWKHRRRQRGLSYTIAWARPFTKVDPRVAFMDRRSVKKEPDPEPEVPTFRSLGLNAEIVRGAAYALGLNPEVSPEVVDLITPAPVQRQAIPSILKGNNVAIASETGSGKSLAFLLPLVQRVRILSELRSMNYGLDWKYGEPLALVLCATRELAIQTHSVLRLIAKAAHVDSCVVFGGAN